MPRDLNSQQKQVPEANSAALAVRSARGRGDSAGAEMPKIELEKELPRLFERGKFLEAVFDGGNAHVSARSATFFVVHRSEIDTLKRAIESADLDGIERALTLPPNGLQYL